MAHGGDPPPGPFPLPARSEPGARPHPDRRRPGRSCYLFDVDDELAAGLDLRMRLVARPLVTARVEEISAGEFDLIPLLAQLRGGLGPPAHRGGRRARRPGRRPHRVRARRRRRPARPVDERRRRRAARLRDLLARARADADRDPRRGVRASASGRGRRSCTRCCAARSGARWSSTSTARRRATRAPTSGSRCCSGTSPSAGGSSSPDGILVPLPLTHRLIGQLVGAERPSVSHALARLASADLVTRKPNGLVLHGTAAHHIACLVERATSARRAHEQHRVRPAPV